METIKSKVAAARKLAKKGACLLRKVDEKKEKFQAEARRLAEKKVTMVAKKDKAKEEIARLRRKLQDLRAGFAAQKEDLEANYQKQADDMFFYGYRCCMKKHDIANDTLSFPSDDEEDEFFGGPAQGDGSVSGDGHAPRGSLSTKDGSHGEQT